MKVAIAGAGVAGSYLALRLARRFDVELFDPLPVEQLGQACAWGINRDLLRRFCRRAGLSFEDYVLYRGRRFVSEMYVINETVVFDKHRFILDLLSASGAELHRRTVGAADLAGNGPPLVVDATGRARALLPRCRDRTRWLLPCYQVVVRGEGLPREFVLQMRGLGYLWVFPMNAHGTQARIGCGSFTVNPRRAVEDYLADELGRLRLEVESAGGDVIRMLPPSMSRPVSLPGRPAVVGAGESVGTVSPLTGEGIGPSLACAELLAGLLLEPGAVKDLGRVGAEYERRLMARFAWVERQHAFMRAVRDGGRLEQLLRLLALPAKGYSLAGFPRWRALLRAALEQSGLRRGGRPGQGRDLR